jgi:hypothetical protein
MFIRLPMEAHMRFTAVRHVVILAGLTAVVAWPSAAASQTVSGRARVVQTTTVDPLGTITTTALADTGTLSDSSDTRQSSQLSGNVPGLVSGGVLHATTIGSPDRVDSEASLANLALTVGGSTIGADFVMARATASRGVGGSGAVSISGLSVNGLLIAVTGLPNQTVGIPGGQIVINEQQPSAGGTVVNALHVVVTGIADVTIGSARAAVQ